MYLTDSKMKNPLVNRFFPFVKLSCHLFILSDFRLVIWETDNKTIISVIILHRNRSLLAPKVSVGLIFGIPPWSVL